MRERIPTKELKVGDRVQVDGISEWGTAIVSQVTETEFKLFRPYGTCTDTVYSGNRVICYTGIEEWSMPRNDHTIERCYSVNTN